MSTLFAVGPSLGARAQKFVDFHNEHPHVFAAFTKFAEQLKDAGKASGSARAIWHRMRWETELQTDETPYLLNDHYTPYYARLLSWTDSRFENFFELRGTCDVSRQDLLEILGKPFGEPPPRQSQHP